MKQIVLKDIIKNYTLNSIIVNAVRGVSLEIEQGEFTALAGPSGSGKTTLLNIIGGLDSPTSGTVSVAGNPITGLTQKQLSDMRLSKIGFIFQAYNLIPVLSAMENVEYILLLQGVSKEERGERSAEILKKVGLAAEMRRLPKDMSGGQQQRIAVARAIVSEPEIVLADEPTANLDQKTGADLLDLMRGLNEEKNITFLFSTHDSMVMERAGRLIRLRDGLIESDSTRNAESKVSRGGVKAVKKVPVHKSAGKKAVNKGK
jgi:putative ABC transport system ATP-binding protein